MTLLVLPVGIHELPTCVPPGYKITCHDVPSSSVKGSEISELPGWLAARALGSQFVKVTRYEWLVMTFLPPAISISLPPPACSVLTARDLFAPDTHLFGEQCCARERVVCGPGNGAVVKLKEEEKTSNRTRRERSMVKLKDLILHLADSLTGCEDAQGLLHLNPPTLSLASAVGS